MTLIKLPVFKQNLISLEMQGFVFKDNLDDFINVIMQLRLKTLLLDNNSFETREAQKILEELSTHDLRLISLKNNFIDIQSFINKINFFQCKTKFNLQETS